jgi:phospholipid transport system substrate-binding protein
VHVRALTRRASFLAASAAIAGTALPARSDTAPVAPIQHLTDELLRIMRIGQAAAFQRRFDILAPVIDLVFDLDAVLRTSVGSTWASLPPGQQNLLRLAFRHYTVSSYVNSFDRFDGQQFAVEPQTRPTANGEQIVRTRITPPSGDGQVLDYVMRNTGSDWRAVDVLADGTISRVAVQRSDFRRLLVGGGAAALAESLVTKALGLSNGRN